MGIQHINKKEEHAVMAERKAKNLEIARRNPNENWAMERLKDSGFKFTRQAVWGKRIFDFWCHRMGIAVEIDGPEHSQKWEMYRDSQNYMKSGIVVLRARNMEEGDMAFVLHYLGKYARTWNERRIRMGLKPMLNAD